MSSRSLTQTRKGQVIWKGKVDVNLNVAEAFFKAQLPGMIVLRTQKKSVDKYGNSLGQYSYGYGKKRERMGEKADRVYMRLTGGLMNSIQGRDSVFTNTSVKVKIGAGANRAKVVKPPGGGKRGRWQIDNSKQGPMYSQILYWLGPGAKGKKRDILGFTRKEIKKIAKMLAKKENILKKRPRGGRR